MTARLFRMWRTPAVAVTALALAIGMATVPAEQTAVAATASTTGPAAWSDQRLAMQLVLAGVQMNHLDRAVTWAHEGVGGIVLFGTAPESLPASLDRIRAAAAVEPFVSSDEEGGEVQRLASLIYPLHSAHWLGAHRSASRIRAIAAAYGTRMRKLGVGMDLAPDADLTIHGRFIAQERRSFGATVARVGTDARAWERGMRSAGVVPVVKHWPGLGHVVTNTDDALARTPTIRYLLRHDIEAFTPSFRDHAPAVMISNAVVPGLSETRKTPASLSPAALRLLRTVGGPDVLIITDSLAAVAVTHGAGLSQPAAAVRALEAGADMALVQDVAPSRVAHAIAAAIASGRYPRPEAVASVRRILAVKRAT